MFNCNQTYMVFILAPNVQGSTSAVVSSCTPRSISFVMIYIVTLNDLKYSIMRPATYSVSYTKNMESFSEFKVGTISVNLNIYIWIFIKRRSNSLLYWK